MHLIRLYEMDGFWEVTIKPYLEFSEKNIDEASFAYSKLMVKSRRVFKS